MNDSTKSNKEIATSMENPDLDDRPVILRIANIDPAKHARRNHIKEVYPKELKEIKVRDESLIIKPRKNHKIYRNYWWYAIKGFVKPWQLITLILLAVTILVGLEISDAIRSKADIPAFCSAPVYADGTTGKIECYG